MTRRICIVTQSDAFAASAGMRIRYERFIQGAAVRDAEIVVRPIDRLIDAPFDCDTYVFCKTFTPLAIVLAAAIRASGRRVGQDLFDDYFSQGDDQRLFQYRGWLRQMAPLTDFALCTTPRMRDVLAPFLPDCPIDLVEDPLDGYDPMRVIALTERKAARRAATRTLRIGWFGIGDNPYFPVGIDDLATPPVMAALARLADRGWATTLTIATNLRALDVDALARLRRLPVAVDLREWSEPVERTLLAEADVVLIPVGGQAFSRAKSLNRALTALERATQVLSLGEPLYERLDAFVYRSVEALADDLDAGMPRLRPDTIADLSALIDRLANPYVSGDAFLAAIERAWDRAAAPSLPAAIHGRAANLDAHRLALAAGGLAIATPYCAQPWDCPVRFDLDGGRVLMRTTPDIADRFALPFAAGQAAGPIHNLAFVTLDPARLPVPFAPLLTAGTGAPLDDLAPYPQVMAGIVATVRALFPGHVPILDDAQPLHPPVPGLTA